MPAVVRVKRRIDEEPLGAFVLNGKKRRLDGEQLDQATSSGFGEVTSATSSTERDEVSTILKFAGTMQSQDDGAISQLARLSKDEAKQLVQQKSRKPSNHTERARQEMRQSLHENRFRVVNCLRTTLDAIDETEGAVSGANTDSEPKEITILDIEKHAVTSLPREEDAATQDVPEITTTGTSIATAPMTDAVNFTQPSDSDVGYVYDLYLPENEQHAAYVDLMDDNYLSVRAFDDLVYEDRFNNDDDDDADDYDSEDSNQENNTANDYPEEGDDDDGDEDEDCSMMRRAVEKFVFDDDDEDDVDEFYDQSSDDEDCVVYSDPYVSSVNVEEEERFIDDVDSCDVNRYGIAYARYKARVLKQFGKDSRNDDNADDDSHSDNDNLNNSDERYHSADETEDC